MTWTAGSRLELEKKRRRDGSVVGKRNERSGREWETLTKQDDWPEPPGVCRVRGALDADAR